MRYEDLDYRLVTGNEDPLQDNITVENPILIGVHAPESKVYIKLNTENRIAIDTDEGGKFEYAFDDLKVDDVLSLQIKTGSKYDEFWQELIRE
ncbi:hypothetical protein [Listeria booriae]|uniref:hypothetical protein n=1 Tax=Listeria booriae TaxID=1552123 RepID=UPI001628F517|nr:hypothetical protein [Listeria booriae]MBC1983009.1 hypothetical protein [Listeria booriae]